MGYYVQLIIVKVDILEPVYVYRGVRERGRDGSTHERYI